MDKPIVWKKKRIRLSRILTIKAEYVIEVGNAITAKDMLKKAKEHGKFYPIDKAKVLKEGRIVVESEEDLPDG